MFALVRLKAGLPAFEFTHVASGAAYFLRFFEPPILPASTPVGLVALYWYEYALKCIIPGCAFIFLIAQKGNPVGKAVAALCGGIILAMLLLVSFTSLPGIAPAEQFEFVLRLRESVSVILWFSAVIAFCRWYFSKTSPRIVSLLAVCGIGVASAASLYLAYPQMNEVRKFAGENVSGAEITAVKKLEEIHKGTSNYVVLASSLLSVAGLREVGFDRTFETPSGHRAHIYPIGPNEGLFPYAQEMLYRGLSNDNLEQLLTLVGGRTIYVAVPTSWWRREEIISDMQKLRARLISGTGDVLLYELPGKSDTQDKY